MQEPFQSELTPEDAETISKNLTRIAERSQRALAELARLQADPSNSADIGRAFVEAATRLFSDPVENVQRQIRLGEQVLNFYGTLVADATGASAGAAAPPVRADRRFRDPAWEQHPVFNFIKGSYLLASDFIDREMRDMPGVEAKTAQTVRFYTKQFVDALAPSNFILTNPEVLRETLSSKGENLVNGLDNLIDDLERGDGDLVVKMTDLDAFEIGRNVAVTEGHVVYQNDLMQLIQYAPTTDTVYRRPLLIVPPWINKYYILDLRPENSLVRWCVDQGYTVFVLSWVNPGPEISYKKYEDYVIEGPLAALDAIEAATGERKASVVGYCIGGTLMATALAYMAATGDDRVAACTLLATQVDFSEPGELGVYLDETKVAALERRMREHNGLLDGAAMASAFNMLRSNDLIWSFFVNNYLLGREPMPFDLLYWNSDATRIPAPVHSYYLRNMYLDNQLVVPEALTVRGVPIDLRKIKTPIYLQAAQDDHIAPYHSVFKGTHSFAGPVRFMLAGSGHIAGVVNPPSAAKYRHWTNERIQGYADADEWLTDATEHPGSWWPDWHAWLSRRSGKRLPAREVGGGALAPIESAPGSYVRVRADRMKARGAA